MHADYESIAKQHRLYYGEGERHLRIYRRLYADRTHFVYELIQNADDTGSKNLTLILRESELLVWNDGRRFDEPDASGRHKNDVRDICSIGLSEKELTQIGTFGIGFKAVYAYTDTPEIYSGHESFQIRRLVEPEAVESPPVEIAQWVAAGKTVFRLPFKQGLRSEEIDQLSLRLSSLEKWTLLFLRSLETIRWRDERNGASGSYASDRQCHGTAAQAWQVNLKNESQGEQQSADSFVVFPKQGVKPPSNVIEELLQQAEEAEDRDRIKRSAHEDQLVEVALRMHDGHVIPTDGCVLFAYLPTAKETHLRFLIQARYQTTPARDNIPTDSAWNHWLIEETANFLPFVLSQIKDAGLLEPEFFGVLPVGSDSVPDFLKPLNNAFERALKEGEFILTDQGEYASPRQVFHASTPELRNLSNDSQLALVTKVEAARWLHRNIRDARHLDLLRTVGVRPFTLDKFAESFSSEFIEAQPDEWITKFYAFLKGHEPLWRAGRYGQPDGPLRSKTIIRLDDRTHVQPFGPSGPNAYLPPEDDTAFPIVKRELIGNEDALEFLKRLGLREPDIVAEVIEFVVPKYEASKQVLPDEEEHHRDMTKIVDALGTDSKKNRETVEEALKKIEFLKGINPTSGRTVYKRPSEVYLRTPELEIYFEGSGGIWFVTETSDQLPPDEFEQLLKGLGVEDKPRRIAFDPKFNAQKLRELRADGRSTGDLEVTDFRLEGLDHFLEKLPGLPAAGGGVLALVLWKLVLLHIPASYKYYHSLPDFFRGSYRYQYRVEHVVPFEAHFTGQLRATPWLPGSDGQLHSASQMSLSELPQNFERNDMLAKVLNMKPETVVSWARERGLDPAALDYLVDEQKFEQFKRWVEEQEKKSSGDTSVPSSGGKEAPGAGPDSPLPGSKGPLDGGGHRSGGEGTGGHRGGSGGGEGAVHRELKEQLARKPEILEAGLRLYRQEPQLQSHYRPDLILQDKEGRYVAVEVESDFPGDNDTGVWQAVAYKHVLAAEFRLSCDRVRGFLAAPRIPDSIKQQCRDLGVEPFELGEGLAAEADPPEST